MRRRDFVAGIAGSAAWPLAAGAQPAEWVRRVGVLMATAESDSVRRGYVGAFQEGLRKLGWADRDIQLDTRWAAERGSVQRLAKELVALQPDLILSHSTPTTAALLQETRTIPIVFATVSDPIGSGFVASSRGQAATSLVSPISNRQWLVSGWSCSRWLPTCHTGGAPVQSDNGSLCRAIFPELLQSRRSIFRRTGNRRACSKRGRA
jgi:hypothetical protein